MNGVVGHVGVSYRSAADRRHNPMISHTPLAPRGSGVKVEIGELLFKGSEGAVPFAKATKTKVTENGNTKKTVFNFSIGDIVPGSVTVTINETPIKEDGKGALEHSDAGSATIDYANGLVIVTTASPLPAEQTVSVEAVLGSQFLGIADKDTDANDDGVNVVVHGSIYSDCATVDGKPASSEVVDFIGRHGIYQ